jgi:hypothetical protein
MVEEILERIEKNNLLSQRFSSLPGICMDGIPYSFSCAARLKQLVIN